MPILKSSKPAQGSTKGKEPDEVPMKHNPAKKSDAFAERYNKSDGKGSYVPPPPGEYQAIITEFKADREEPGVKESVRFQCNIVNNDDGLDGKACSIWYNITNDKGEDMPGLDFLKGSLAMLGLDKDLESWEHLEKVLAELGEAKPWVIINVTETVKNGKKYSNTYLNSVMEDQDAKPDFPF